MRPAGAVARGSLLVLMLVAWPPAAVAKTSATVPYSVGEVWPTTIRLLRVDRDYPIREKDEPAGYVMFQIPEGGRTYKAAMELVATTDSEGRRATQVIVSIPDLPRHHESALMERLQAKLRAERGPPVAPPRSRMAGTDSSERESSDKARKRDKPDAGGDGVPRAGGGTH